MCFRCNQHLKEDQMISLLSEESKQSRLSALSTVPKTLNPTSFDDFNYGYDAQGVLRNKESKSTFQFVTQRHYEVRVKLSSFFFK